MKSEVQCPFCSQRVSLWAVMKAGNPSRIRCQHCKERIKLANLKSFLIIYIPAVLLLAALLVFIYFLFLVNGWILLFIGIVLFEVIEFGISAAIIRRGIFEKP